MEPNAQRLERPEILVGLLVLGTLLFALSMFLPRDEPVQRRVTGTLPPESPLIR
jgi:hypothetical protein